MAQERQKEKKSKGEMTLKKRGGDKMLVPQNHHDNLMKK